MEYSVFMNGIEAFAKEESLQLDISGNPRCRIDLMRWISSLPCYAAIVLRMRFVNRRGESVREFPNPFPVICTATQPAPSTTYQPPIRVSLRELTKLKSELDAAFLFSALPLIIAT